MRIDAHHHFWSIARADYGWLTPDKTPIYRDFSPDDLRPLLKSCNIDKTVLVQAAPTVEETEYLLGIADATDFVAKVVGWVDFEDPGHRNHLQRFAGHAKFAGVRPMVQDIADPEWMHRPDIAWAYQAIQDLDLTFDALGLPVHCAPFLRLCERYPDMRVVIDHCLKPQIGDRAFDEWAAAMARIAADTNAYCKLSGIVTEAGPDWNRDSLKPYVEHILEIFGPDRLMWGSDWPVLGLASDYESWSTLATSFVTRAEDQARIFGLTAAHFYGIEG